MMMLVPNPTVPGGIMLLSMLLSPSAVFPQQQLQRQGPQQGGGGGGGERACRVVWWRPRTRRRRGYHPERARQPERPRRRPSQSRTHPCTPRPLRPRTGRRRRRRRRPLRCGRLPILVLALRSRGGRCLLCWYTIRHAKDIAVFCFCTKKRVSIWARGSVPSGQRTKTAFSPRKKYSAWRVNCDGVDCNRSTVGGDVCPAGTI